MFPDERGTRAGAPRKLRAFGLGRWRRLESKACMRNRRLLAAIAIFAALMGAFVAFAFVARSGATLRASRPLTQGSAVVGDGHVSALDAPLSSNDVPSARTLELQAARSMLRDANDVRLAEAIGRVKVFIAPGKRPSDLCLIVEDASESSTAIDCGARSILTKGAIYMTKPDSENRSMDVFAVVSDGVTSVGPAIVKNNVAVIWGFSGQLVTLKNLAGQLSTQDLGPQF
jgi:hypothetical protein